MKLTDIHASDIYADLDDTDGCAAPSGWGSTAPIFDSLISDVRPRLIIEVGSWLGASAIHMANICKSIGIETKILCVDTFLGAYEFWTNQQDVERYIALKCKHGYPQVYFDFLRNVKKAGHADCIIPFPQTSLIAARYLWHHQVRAELIYIDGSHDAEDVAADIRAYWPLLKPGGVLFGDDYDSFEDVRRALAATGHAFDVVGGRYWVMRHD